MIFASNGRNPVKSLSQDFADGGKYCSFKTDPTLFIVRFVELFNLLFDEQIDLKLTTQTLVDARMANWNKINMAICFNYLQQ